MKPRYRLMVSRILPEHWAVKAIGQNGELQYDKPWYHTPMIL